jgi:hypothetical protein
MALCALVRQFAKKVEEGPDLHGLLLSEADFEAENAEVDQVEAACQWGYAYAALLTHVCVILGCRGDNARRSSRRSRRRSSRASS